jgi:large subunit ribosomal protein L23
MKTIIKPFITEKTLSLASRGWYTFAVDPSAGKRDIARDVNSVYNVIVTAVRTVGMHGKMRRVGKGMQHVKRQDWKKAAVRLAKGQKIDAFEVTTQEEPKKVEEKSRRKVGIPTEASGLGSKFVIIRSYIGAWLSLVERLVRDQEVVGSNPAAPIFFNPSL